MVSTNPTQKVPLGGNNKNDVSTYIANLDEACITPGVPFVYNLGIALSAGVLTFQGADGSALSASSTADGNPAIFGFQDKATPGQLVWVEMAANQTIQDDSHATSHLLNNLFGTEAGTAWPDDMPFTIYACVNDAKTAVALGISRYSDLTVAPVAGSIGTSASATADDQFSLFLAGGVTIADYDGNPVIPVGTVRAQKSSSDDWTFQTLSTEDGVGRFHVNKTYNFTPDVGGSSSDPTTGWSTATGVYTRMGRMVHIHIRLIGDGSTYTGGSGSLQIENLPFTSSSNSEEGDNSLLNVSYLNLNVAGTMLDLNAVTVAGSNYLRLQETFDNGTLSNASVGDLANNGRLYISGTYLIDID